MLAPRKQDTSLTATFARSKAMWESGDIGLLQKGLSVAFLAQIMHTLYEYFASNRPAPPTGASELDSVTCYFEYNAQGVLQWTSAGREAHARCNPP